MRSSVALDWRWADGHMRAIVDVLRKNAMHIMSINVASDEKDLIGATDLIISVQGGDVAVRIRRNRYRDQYRDLTIRAWRASGMKTELDKLLDGFGDWYLYAWSDGQGGLSDWMLIDLHKLRQSGLLSKRQIKYNKDKRTGFLAISDRELRQSDCLVSESDDAKQ